MALSLPLILKKKKEIFCSYLFPYVFYLLDCYNGSVLNLLKVPGLNLGRVTRSPDSGFNDFPEPVYANARRVPSNRLSRDPSKSLPTHRSWSPFNLIRHCKVSGI